MLNGACCPSQFQSLGCTYNQQKLEITWNYVQHVKTLVILPLNIKTKVKNILEYMKNTMWYIVATQMMFWN